VLRVQSAGFLAIIAVSWFNELIDLRSLILGDNPYISHFGASALEMLIVLGVWFLVVRATRRVIQRVHYLEVSCESAPGATTLVSKQMVLRPPAIADHAFALHEGKAEGRRSF